MLGGRPNTAKRVLSPRGQKIKTEGKDLDINQLCDAIQETIAKQKQCERQGKYVEAEAFKRKAKALKEELEDRQMGEYQTKHERELKELEEAHKAEMNLFAMDWQRRIDDFNKEIEHTLNQLRVKHQKQLRQLEGEEEKEKKFHQSPKLLELRKIESQLGRQQNYIEAHRVQQKANKLQKEQQQKHSKNQSTKKKHQINLLKTRQQSELQTVKMRIQLQVEERQRQRLKEQEILKQKYENILKETQFQQNQELNSLNKKVKLSQLQKKSKVGMFSISKD